MELSVKIGDLQDEVSKFKKEIKKVVRNQGEDIEDLKKQVKKDMTGLRKSIKEMNVDSEKLRRDFNVLAGSCDTNFTEIMKI